MTPGGNALPHHQDRNLNSTSGLLGEMVKELNYTIFPLVPAKFTCPQDMVAVVNGHMSFGERIE